MTDAPDEKLPISYGLDKLVKTFSDPLSGVALDKHLTMFMTEVCSAVQKLEAATATASAFEASAGDKSRIAYTVAEVAELVPVSRDRVWKAARSGSLRAHQRGTRGRWIVRRADVIDWAGRGCPAEIELPSGLSPRSRLLRDRR